MPDIAVDPGSFFDMNSINGWLVGSRMSIGFLSVECEMISTRQVKAARAMLNWSQEELARRSGVSYPTIARLEAEDGELGGRPDTAEKIKTAIEVAGIEFTNGDTPGVKLRKPL